MSDERRAREFEAWSEAQPKRLAEPRSERGARTTMRRAFVLLALWAGCASWHVLRPTTANNVQVGSMTLYVVSAEYAQSGDRLKLVLVVDNRTQEPQQFDPGWVTLRGASGMSYTTDSVRPPAPGSVLPFSRMQLTYMFRRIPQPEVQQLTLMVAGTATMQFAGYY